MKIICAGLLLTGTKYLHEALNILGYNVYDFIDHFWEHDKHWKKIFARGASSEDFRKMYENVDVIMDMPVFSFWEKISNAFPNAKVRTKNLYGAFVLKHFFVEVEKPAFIQKI